MRSKFIKQGRAQIPCDLRGGNLTRPFDFQGEKIEGLVLYPDGQLRLEEVAKSEISHLRASWRNAIRPVAQGKGTLKPPISHVHPLRD
jgi:hypothetical protein